jgi:hypothetical protein
LTAEEVLAQLEDRENSMVQMEAESNARLGTVYSRGLEENEMSVGRIEREISESTSTGLMSTNMSGSVAFRSGYDSFEARLEISGLGTGNGGQILTLVIPW